MAWAFRLGLLLKAVNGGLEVVVALLVLYVPPSVVLSLAEFVTQGEVTQDPDDLITTSLTTISKTGAVAAHHLFALYLILHGGVKILLVLGILAGKRIAYPLFMAALVLFGSYEAYRGIRFHDAVILVVSALDLLLLVLTVHDYRRQYSSRGENGSAPDSVVRAQ